MIRKFFRDPDDDTEIRCDPDDDTLDPDEDLIHGADVGD